jgi:hypothetical protein
MNKMLGADKSAMGAVNRPLLLSFQVAYTQFIHPQIKKILDTKRLSEYNHSCLKQNNGNISDILVIFKPM